ncbi:MAG: MBL fold metallo-hydrolase [Planctomycetaceae bacterium]|nr:MBL fold metallo-hydrolase [Planctomycetaceae bacterium]
MDIVPDERCDLETLLHAPEDPPQPGISWLGQAGFLIRWRALRLAIDPYLSDYLATKYRGTQFPHTRLAPPPVAPERLAPLQVVLCTHAHSDHMDPETLPRIAAANPQCRFVVPRAERATALARGVPAPRLVPVNAGDHVPLAPDLTLQVLPAAHEQLRTDAEGNHHCLGYVLHLVLDQGTAALYHSGDCVPFAGLDTALAACGARVALLPVNGRDEHRRAHGIPGNFTFDEATALCLRCRISAMMACHFGMFDFNTVDESWLDRQIARVPALLQCLRPQLGRVCWLRSRHTVAPAATPDQGTLS